MDRKLAEEIVSELAKANEILSNVELLARNIDDENIRNRVRRFIGKVTADIHTHAMSEVLCIYPDLEPYK